MAKKDTKMVPEGKKHWEMHYNPNDPSDIMKQNGGASFNPRGGNERSRVYKKINETDY